MDLPTPGSPANRTTAPGTSPPPSTRSSSVTPVGRLRAVVMSTADIGHAGAVTAAVARARLRAPARWVERTAGTWASIVPQVLQRGQRPAHLTDSAPHPLHRKPTDAAREPDRPGAFGRGAGGRDDMARTVSGRSDNSHGAAADLSCQSPDDVGRLTMSTDVSRRSAIHRRPDCWSQPDCWSGWHGWSQPRSPVVQVASRPMPRGSRTLPEPVAPRGRRG